MNELRLKSSYKSTAPTQSQPQTEGDNLAGDLGVNVAGGIGGTIGQIIGTPFDLLTGPGGTMAGGAIGGGLAQGGAEAVRELLSGKGFSWQDIASQTGQGAAWGAVPFGEEARTAAMGGKLLAKTGIKALAKKAGKKVLVGAPAGMAVQGIQDVRQGKNPLTDPNVLTSGGVSGAINAIAPGLSETLGLSVKAVAGNAKNIYGKLAEYMVGSGYDVNPLVKNNLVYQDIKNASGATVNHFWQQSERNLRTAAKKLYEPLANALKPKTAGLGDFLDSITQGGTKMLSKDSKIQNLIFDVANYIERNSKGSLGNISAQIKQLQDYESKSGVDLSKQYGQLMNDLNKIKVSGDVLNNAKQIIGKGGTEAAPMYQEAKKFVEKLIGKDTETAQINKNYHDLTEAADNIVAKFKDKTIPPFVHGSNFMERAGQFIAGSALGDIAGFPQTGGMFNIGSSIGGGSAVVIANVLKDMLTKTPQRAEKYANVLQRLGKLNPIVENALKQILLRGGQGAINSQSASQ